MERKDDADYGWDMHLLKVDPWDVHNRNKWRARGRGKGNPQRLEHRLKTKKK